MIRLALAGNDRTLYVVGITDMDVAALKRGVVLTADLADLGGEGEVVIVYGATAKDLGAHLATGVPDHGLPTLYANLDQLDAMERDAA